MSDSLRIVTFNILTIANTLVTNWAARHGHRIILVVTSPAGSEARYGASYLRLVESLPPTQDVLITTKMRRTVAPVLAALAPDLIISATFPHRIPPEVTAIPRYGALNLHPAPLPRGRGPNPMRMIYEGDTMVGGTVHRIEPEWDAGPILAQHRTHLPDDATPEAIFSTWAELLTAALDEGVPRAVAGEAGEPQDEQLATYGTQFTEAERWLTWDRPSRLLQLQATALAMAGPGAMATIDGQPVAVAWIRALPGSVPETPPGTVIERNGDRVVVRTADGMVEVTMGDSAEGDGSG
jgi:methionyl-tRNA formyltransferase